MGADYMRNINFQNIWSIEGNRNKVHVSMSQVAHRAHRNPTESQDPCRVLEGCRQASLGRSKMESTHSSHFYYKTKGRTRLLHHPRRAQCRTAGTCISSREYTRFPFPPPTQSLGHDLIAMTPYGRCKEQLFSQIWLIKS